MGVVWLDNGIGLYTAIPVKYLVNEKYLRVISISVHMP
jgi:hypothetical protein